MVVKGFPLIKFQSEERIESLQNGLIYMNSLEWFRNNESDNGDEVIGDSFEAMFHINEEVYVSLVEQWVQGRSGVIILRF